MLWLTIAVSAPCKLAAAFTTRFFLHFVCTVLQSCLNIIRHEHFQKIARQRGYIFDHICIRWLAYSEYVHITILYHLGILSILSNTENTWKIHENTNKSFLLPATACNSMFKRISRRRPSLNNWALSNFSTKDFKNLHCSPAAPPWQIPRLLFALPTWHCIGFPLTDRNLFCDRVTYAHGMRSLVHMGDLYTSGVHTPIAVTCALFIEEN